jgi:hypothetical protein
VPDRDAAGQILTTDGTVWTPGMGQARIKWIANEGIRISSIIAWLDTASTTVPAEQCRLLREVLSPPTEVVVPAAAPPAPPVPQAAPPAQRPAQPTQLAQPSPAEQQAQPAPAGGSAVASADAVVPGAVVSSAAGNGEITVTVPLQITVRLGGA